MTTAELKKHLPSVQTNDLRTLIEQASKELARALPEHMRAERLVRIALTCIRQNPELTKCTPESFMGSLFVSAQLGIEPVGGRAYLLPFNNRRNVNGEWTTVKEAQFILGYKGLAELFYRHEKAVMLAWAAVYENDGFEYEYGTNAKLIHKPASKNRGKVIGFYVVATLANGGKPFLYMSLEDCLAHGKKHSKTYDKRAEKFYDSSPWVTNQEAMCLKTVLVQLGKLLPLSVEIQKAIAADETSRDYKRGIDDAMDLTPTTTWEPEAAPAAKDEFVESETVADEFPESKPAEVQQFSVKRVSKSEIAGQAVFIIVTTDDKRYHTQSEDFAKLAKDAAKDGFKLRGQIENIDNLDWATGVDRA